jgi:ribosomal protein L24E
MTKKYCENCEIELSEDIIKFERNDGIVFDFCSEECKNQSIKFWRHKGLDIIEIKNPKDIKIFSSRI